MIKRRTADSAKPRRIRTIRKNDTIYNSTLLYLKFLLLWGLVLLADFLLEFRFEYLLPFWLMLTSVCDSYKYEGISFSVFFVCVVFTSDVICLFFVPVEWLFFLASTYVWVQYVWHMERGVCLPTFTLWVLFIYVEAAVRLKDLRIKPLPTSLDLCRPFAAHSIGYPVVALGFGFKTFMSYRYRLRRQKTVGKDNEFYFQLLRQALPRDLQTDCIESEESSKNPEILSNGFHNLSGFTLFTSNKSNNSTETTNTSKSYIVEDISSKCSLSSVTAKSSCSALLVSSLTGGGTILTPLKKISNTCFVDSKDVTERPLVLKTSSSEERIVKKEKPLSNNKVEVSKKSKPATGTTYETKRNSSESGLSSLCDDKVSKWEDECKQLRSELQSLKSSEHDLKIQLQSKSVLERAAKSESEKLRTDAESLQNKMQNLFNDKQQYKQTVTTLEKKLEQEKKQKIALEKQLKALELDYKNLKPQNDLTEKICMLEKSLEQEKQQRINTELQKLQFEKKYQMQKKSDIAERETLLCVITSLTEKNSQLDSSLKNENKLKCELFSALSDSKRQLEIAQNRVYIDGNDIDFWLDITLPFESIEPPVGRHN